MSNDKNTIMRGKLLSGVVRFHSELTELSAEAMSEGALRVVGSCTALQTATVQCMSAFEMDDPGVIQVIRDNNKWRRESTSDLQLKVDELEGELAIERAKHSASKASVSMLNEAVEPMRPLVSLGSEVPDSFKEAHPGLSPVSLVTAWRMQQSRTVEAAGIEID